MTTLSEKIKYDNVVQTLISGSLDSETKKNV